MNEWNAHFEITVTAFVKKLTSTADGDGFWSAIVQSIPVAVRDIFTSCLELPNAAQQSKRALLEDILLGTSISGNTSRKSSTMSLRHRNAMLQHELQSDDDLSIGEAMLLPERAEIPSIITSQPSLVML